MHYRLRTPTKTEAQQLAAPFGIDWNDETHLTIQDERGRMDIVVLGDLPQQDADGNIVMNAEEPVMLGLFHVDILSTFEIDHAEAGQYLVTPKYPLHKFL